MRMNVTRRSHCARSWRSTDRAGWAGCKVAEPTVESVGDVVETSSRIGPARALTASESTPFGHKLMLSTDSRRRPEAPDLMVCT